MEVLKEKKGFRLEAYQMKDGGVDYYIINSLHNTYSFVIRSLDKALEEFRAA
jgi:hypothetical protein